MPTLDLLQGARSRVWLAVRDLAVNDDVLKRTIQTFIVWDGSKISASPDLTSMMPLLRMSPKIGPQQWYSPDAIYGPLNIDVLMAIQTRDAVDALNLWEAFENVYYPYGDRARQMQIQQALRDAGAETGQIEFTAPANDPDPRVSEDGVFNMLGSIRLSVIRTYNP